MTEKEKFTLPFKEPISVSPAAATLDAALPLN